MIIIDNMELEDYEKIENILEKDFDDFWTKGVFISELKSDNSKYIVAKENDDIVGYAGIWISPVDVEITNIVVKKSKRRKGIGCLLLEKLIEITKDLKIDNISLEVNENNYSAIKLYEKYEFKVVGMRKKYYNGKDNAIIMTKYL